MGSYTWVISRVTAEDFFLEGAAKRVFWKVRPNFVSVWFAASYWGSAISRVSCLQQAIGEIAILGGVHLQQTFRKLAGKSHLQGLLLQAIGEIQFWGFISSKTSGNFAFWMMERVDDRRNMLKESHNRGKRVRKERVIQHQVVQFCLDTSHLQTERLYDWLVKL